MTINNCELVAKIKKRAINSCELVAKIKNRVINKKSYTNKRVTDSSVREFIKK